MTQLDHQITRYIRSNPDVRDAHVAKIFGVEYQHVNTLRRREGLYPARKAAAIARNMKQADLDDKILREVYRRGLVDEVLQDRRT